MNIPYCDGCNNMCCPRNIGNKVNNNLGLDVIIIKENIKALSEAFQEHIK